MEPSRYDKAVRQLERRVARAVRDFDLIGDGDKVLVAVSGGKDSLVLLDALVRRRVWRPEHYGLVACHVVDGSCSDGCDYPGRLAAYCHELGVPLRLLHEETVPSDEDLESGARPCWLCSWRRRKILIRAAGREGCNLIALGHHKDDVAETLLLNLMWQGRHESMLPKQPLFAGRVTLVRPLCLADEITVDRVARLGELPVHACVCVHAENSRRETAKDIIRTARAAGVRDVTSNLVRTVFEPADRREKTGRVADRIARRESVDGRPADAADREGPEGNAQ